LIAVFAIDPGKATGLASGIFDETQKSMYQVLKKAKRLQTTTISGTPVSQARQLSARWRSFRSLTYALDGVPLENIYMLIEDFQISPTTPPGEQILWAMKVTWCLVGYRHGGADEWDRQVAPPLAPVEIEWQSPSQAKSYATDERLRRWGLWVKGKDHERDALRHVAAFLNNHIK